MSRAFTSEGDGWNYCRSRRESCAYADEFGRCIVRRCIYDPEPAAEPSPADAAAPPATP
jgi:hypothetical protein